MVFAALAYDTFKYSEQEQALRKLLSLQKDESDLATTLYYLSTCLYRQMRVDEANEYIIQALHKARSICGGRNPLVADILNSTGNFKRIQAGKVRNSERALTLFNEAQGDLVESLTIRQELFGLEHPETARSYHNLGRLYLSQKQYVQAEEYLTRALNIRQKSYDKGNRLTAETRLYLGISQLYQGRLLTGSSTIISGIMAVPVTILTLGIRHLPILYDRMVHHSNGFFVLF